MVLIKCIPVYKYEILMIFCLLGVLNYWSVIIRMFADIWRLAILCLWFTFCFHQFIPRCSAKTQIVIYGFINPSITRICFSAQSLTGCFFWWTVSVPLKVRLVPQHNNQISTYASFYHYQNWNIQTKALLSHSSERFFK